MKYCKNCNKETERYKKGNCKECVKNRTKSFNEKRSKESVKEILYKQNTNTKQEFNREIYTKFNLQDVIKLSKDNVVAFVYFLIKDNELVYVGKSNNRLLERLSRHLMEKDFDDVYYKPFINSEYASKTERQLITKYKPKLNKEFIFSDAKYKLFDLKTEEVVEDTKENLIKLLNTSETSINGLINEVNKSLYSRYVLYKNKPIKSTFKNVLDNHTGLIEKHNYITFAEKVGKTQNQVWYFMSGLTKTFMKKRYTLVK
jgi:hypothetical protein